MACRVMHEILLGYQHDYFGRTNLKDEIEGSFITEEGDDSLYSDEDDGFDDEDDMDEDFDEDDFADEDGDDE